MRVSFKPRGDGSAEAVISAALAERDRFYCKHHGQFAEAMVDPDAMRVVAFVWEAPACPPDGCREDGCLDCPVDVGSAPHQVYYEAWEHPRLFAAASRALAEPIGACDAILLVPEADVPEGLSREDLACIAARDIAEIAMLRAGHCIGADPRSVLVHHAAAALLLQTCTRDPFGFDKPTMESLRDRLAEWSMGRLADAPRPRRGGGQRGSPALPAALNLAWRMAALKAPAGPFAPNGLLPAAEAIAARAIPPAAAARAA